MKNTSIFIPLLLIACLAALIYLAFAALRAAEESNPEGPAEITLNAEDYQPDNANSDADATLNTSELTTDAGGDYLEEVPREEQTEEDEDDLMDTSGNGSATTTTTVSRPQPTTTTTAPAATANGRYLVIAGSFRQDSGARERVAALRAAGFANTRMERFNRGTYAVALAGQYDRYSSAKALADKISTRGFEVRVMKRR